MAKVEQQIKRLAKYFIFYYFAIPNPEAGGVYFINYARKIQQSKLGQKLKSF